GLAPLLGVDSLDLLGDHAVHESDDQSRADAVRLGHARPHPRFLSRHHLPRLQSVRASRLDSNRRPRSQSAAAESGHGDSSAQSPVGKWFAGFLILAIVVTAYLVSTRLKDLRSNAELESMVSREAAFLYNNLVLVGIAFSVLWGTLFPIISEAVRGNKITVGPPFFNTVNIPLGLLLLLLTGIGPLIAWRRASVANLKGQFIVPCAVGLAS